MLRAMLIRGVVVSCALVALASGCAYGPTRQVIRAQFASELSCPEVKLTKRNAWYAEENPNQYKVTGCGVVRTYTCTGDEELVSYDEPACTWVEGDADAPQHKASPDAAPVDEAMDTPMDDSSNPEMGMEQPTSSNDDFDSDVNADAEVEAPKPTKAKAKAKAKGGLRFGSD